MGSVSQVNLFGVEVKKKRTSPAKNPGAHAAVNNLISIYKQGYERKFDEPPVIVKSDGPLLYKLVEQFGAVKVEQRLRAFMAWDDQFVVDSGFSLRMLHTRWNALAARSINTAERSTVADADKTAAYLQSRRANR